jgi:hypothetical protein
MLRRRPLAGAAMNSTHFARTSPPSPHPAVAERGPSAALRHTRDSISYFIRQSQKADAEMVDTSSAIGTHRSETAENDRG